MGRQRRLLGVATGLTPGMLQNNPAMRFAGNKRKHESNMVLGGRCIGGFPVGDALEGNGSGSFTMGSEYVRTVLSNSQMEALVKIRETRDRLVAMHKSGNVDVSEPLVCEGRSGLDAVITSNETSRGAACRRPGMPQFNLRDVCKVPWRYVQVTPVGLGGGCL